MIWENMRIKLYEIKDEKLNLKNYIMKKRTYYTDKTTDI